MKSLYVFAVGCGFLCRLLCADDSSGNHRLRRDSKDWSRMRGGFAQGTQNIFSFWGIYLLENFSRWGGLATTAKVDENFSGAPVLNKYKTRTVHFPYAPAFQIGMGVNLPRDHWDVAMSWLRST